MMEHVVIFGAGAIGRGLMADLVTRAGYRPVFVEADAELARSLRQVGAYTIRLVGVGQEERRIEGYEVLTTDQTDEISRAVDGCRFAVTNVGGRNLPALGPMIAPGLKRRQGPLNVLVCENWPHADRVLADAIFSEGVSQKFTALRCSVERMVRRSEASLDLSGEFGQSLFVDALPWIGERPQIEEMHFTDRFEAYYARKLYTNNAGHALLAYEGHLAGCAFIHEAMDIPWIRNDLDELLQAASRMMVLHFSLDPAEMDRHVNDLVRWRFANRELADPIERVAREPVRKLGANERLVGLAKLLQEHNLPTQPVARAIASALCYQNETDPESLQLAETIRTQGPASVLEEICELTPQDAFYTESLHAYEQYAKKTKETRSTP